METLGIKASRQTGWERMKDNRYRVVQYLVQFGVGKTNANDFPVSCGVCTYFNSNANEHQLSGEHVESVIAARLPL